MIILWSESGIFAGGGRSLNFNSLIGSAEETAECGNGVIVEENIILGQPTPALVASKF